MIWSIRVQTEGIQLEGNIKSQKWESRYDSGNRKESNVTERKLQEFILVNILNVHFSKYYILAPLSGYIVTCKWAEMLPSIDNIWGRRNRVCKELSWIQSTLQRYLNFHRLKENVFHINLLGVSINENTRPTKIKNLKAVFVMAKQNIDSLYYCFMF